MRCAWQELLSILPQRLRADVDRLGRESLVELRLRINAPPEMVLLKGNCWLSGNVTQEEIAFVVNAASRYSPWTAVTMAQGYLTAEGGHRIGVCGEVICKEYAAVGFRTIRSLCIRIARDVTGIAKKIPHSGSVLILGAPGWGKTTLLRDFIRQIADLETVCAIDEREELFPKGFSVGKRMDILSGCPKAQGTAMALRTMGPDWIAVDEITEEEDCRAVINAANCGARLAATAHGSSMQDWISRPVYKMLSERQIFETIVVLRKDKTYTVERMKQCNSNGSARYS